MSRYVQDIVLNKPDDFVNFMMSDFIHKYDFFLHNWKGENCYRSGDAFMTGYRYFTWGYRNGVLHLEAWLRGPFGTEMGLTGFYGWAVKAGYKKEVDEIIRLLQQPLPGDGTSPRGIPGGNAPMHDTSMNGAPVNGAPGTENPMSGAPGQGPIPVHVIDTSRHAVPGLVLGILSIVFSLLVPYLGILLAIFGFIYSKKAIHSAKGKMATAGFVCSIIGAALGFGLIFLNFFLTLT